MWTVTDDGSVIDKTGKVIFFSTQRFVKDICLGHCCFICGAHPGSRPFNDEHILPEWLLRKYYLFERTIALPNEGAVRYGRYKIPCCSACNSLMGRLIEDPVSTVMKGGSNAINAFIKEGHALIFFVWLGLIYLKTHLKDRAHRVHMDARRGERKIADDYDWEHLHHIHSVVRCFYTGCAVENEAIGSFLVTPVKRAIDEHFDFADLYLAQSMVLRLNDIGFVSVFNDSGGAIGCFKHRLMRITGPVAELQLREIFVELAFLNLHIKQRPIFRTECDIAAETCRVVAELPKLELKKIDLRLRGKLFHQAMRDVLPHLTFLGRSREEVIAAIEAGTLTLLFDDEGKFVEDPVKPS